jgi:hypothetical protein
MQLATRVERLAERLSGLIRRIDPAPRPTKLSTPFLVCFASAVVITSWLLATNRYLPGQDYSYHAHCSRVWLDAGRAGSPYAGYEPTHALEANTLMYSTAGLLSHLGSSYGAFRFVQAYYFLGLPLACLYALRALDRSPWGSLLAFPLCYTEVFAAGYANMAFASPTFILALVEYRRFTQEISWRRGVIVAVLFAAVFLSHAHVYLWLGGLVVLYTVAIFVERVFIASTPRVTLRSLLVFVGGAAATAVPSLMLFARWYGRGYGRGNSVGASGNDMAFQKTMEWTPLPQKFMAGALQAFSSTTNKLEVVHILSLGLLVMFSMALARSARDRSAPLPELAILVTVVSFFLLPDAIALQMVAVRQWYFVFWLLPLVVVPVPLRFGPVKSVAVIAALLGWTASRMSVLTGHLQHFKNEEMAGFEQVVRAAPRVPGLTVAYAAVNARSKYWLTSPMYHSYGFLSAERGYDGPLEYSDARSVVPVRYAKGPPRPVKHLYGSTQWLLDPVIWQYDLILVYRWSPTPSQQQAARERGTLVATAGDWQLWQTRKP